MNQKHIKALIIIDAVIGFTVLCLNFGSSSTSVYNFLVFLLLVYFYSKTQNKMYIPYFILQFFVFTLVLLNRLFPQFLDDKDPFVNNSMIVISILAVLFMIIATFSISKKNHKG